MADENITKVQERKEGGTASVASGREGAPQNRFNGSRDGRDRRRSPMGGRNPRGRRNAEKFKPEFDQKILDIRRVTRVMAGGRRFSFSVTLAAGDRKGRVGVGLGKGADTAIAIEKAFNNAKKNMLKLSLQKNMSIPHEVEAKYCSSRLVIMPAPGKGLVAGSAVRSVLDLGGVHDVSAKILSRSKNSLNNARAAVLALSRLSGEEKRSSKEGRESHTSTKAKAADTAEAKK
ncbi:MAG TPA: 30S ribosomal protein S5 [Candidatus Paceibacterota bacterium]|nr:30S ribosomal protein S5 [Candidatus Paceibacterota bacterium]